MNQLMGLKRSSTGDVSAGFQSVEEALSAWFQTLEVTASPSTVKRCKVQVKRFVSAWEELPWELAKADIWRYMDLYSQGCTNFRANVGRNHIPACLNALDLTDCSSHCSGYEPVKIQTVGAHLQAVSSFYRFLEQRNMVSQNIVAKVREEWAKQNKHRFRKPVRRVPTKEEIRILLKRTLPNHAAVYAVMAKCGPRIGEALKLKVDALHFVPGNWLVIPDFYGKRRGNRKLCVDSELWRVLEPYLEWRDERMSVNGVRHDFLFVRGDGEPFCQGKDPAGDFNSYLRLDQERLGLARNGNHFTAHGFRHFFSDELKRNGCDDFFWHLLRGDVPRGNQDVYLHPTDAELKTHFLAHAPRFY